VKSDRSVHSRRARPVLDQRPYVTPRYQTNIWSRLIFVILILALCGGVGIVGGVYWAIHRSQGSSAQLVSFHVGSGDSVASIADRLQRLGLVDNALLFRLDARFQNLGSKLKVGDYALRRDMSIDEFVAALQVLHVQYVRITIPEGWRMEQIAARVAHYGIDGRQFLQEAEHPTLSSAVYPILRDKPPRASLEGYLFPDTYYVPLHSSGREFAAFMVRNLANHIGPQMHAQIARERLSVFKVLILSSIVEREARDPSERPLIASVYTNRLTQGQGLFADPTVQFAMRHISGVWWPVIRQDPHSVNSPYNTYLHVGLPPGPIAEPGLASIQAVINPANTSYLYFVAKGHGQHAFETTLPMSARTSTPAVRDWQCTGISRRIHRRHDFDRGPQARHDHRAGRRAVDRTRVQPHQDWSRQRSSSYEDAEHQVRLHG
jgi:UPF0755 protein